MTTAKPEMKEIELNLIQAKDNYRQTFNEKSLKELAASIKKNGVVQPIILRKIDGGGYAIIAGERRYRAAKMAGLVTIPSIVREVDAGDILTIQLIENIQREGVPFMEEAYALEKLQNEHELTVGEIAGMLGKSEVHIYHMLQLTKMSSEAQEVAISGWINKAVAFHIARLEKPEDQTQAAQSLARKSKEKLITEHTAKQYIRDKFTVNTAKAVKSSPIRKAGGSEFLANWKVYLIRFNSQQFATWKGIVKDRTDIKIWAEAVDVVLRENGAKN